MFGRSIHRSSSGPPRAQIKEAVSCFCDHIPPRSQRTSSLLYYSSHFLRGKSLLPQFCAFFFFFFCFCLKMKQKTGMSLVCKGGMFRQDEVCITFPAKTLLRTEHCFQVGFSKLALNNDVPSCSNQK